jgi:hypothetical protein
MMSDDQKPPLFKSWKSWYIIVLGVLVVQFILYVIITKAFS